MMKVESCIIAEELTFPERPRWREHRLEFSDFYNGAVYLLRSTNEKR